MNESSRPQLSWRLRVRMAENRITTATELKRRLDAIGYEITSAQLSRIVDERPAQIKTALLEALLSILGGTLNDLMPLDGKIETTSQASSPEPTSNQSPSAPVPAPTRKRKSARPTDAPPSEEDAGGPKVRPFSIPPKK